MTNPLVATGIVMVAILSLGAILAASSHQVSFSKANLQSQEIQNDKLKETIDAAISENGITIKNNWQKTTTIKEIRVLDDQGNLVRRTPVDIEVEPFRKVHLDDAVLARNQSESIP